MHRVAARSSWSRSSCARPHRFRRSSRRWPPRPVAAGRTSCAISSGAVSRALPCRGDRGGGHRAAALAMRLAALLVPDADRAFTENGNRIGDITVGGTVTLVVLGLLFGAIAGHPAGSSRWPSHSCRAPRRPSGRRDRARASRRCAARARYDVPDRAGQPRLRRSWARRPAAVGVLVMLVAAFGPGLVIPDAWLDRRRCLDRWAQDRRTIGIYTTLPPIGLPVRLLIERSASSRPAHPSSPLGRGRRAGAGQHRVMFDDGPVAGGRESGAAAAAAKYAEPRLSRTSASKPSGSTSSNGRASVRPALFTRMSRPPRAPIARATRSVAAPGTARSAARLTARPASGRCPPRSPRHRGRGLVMGARAPWSASRRIARPCRPRTGHERAAAMRVGVVGTGHGGAPQSRRRPASRPRAGGRSRA